ncbi:MAG: hypothetical protein AABW84_02050 [Nanoarchaeota archaeon]
MRTLEERTLTRDDFSKSGRMEVRLENNYVVPIDKSDARGLRIKYDKMFCLKIDDKRVYDYTKQKDNLTIFYATFGFPLLSVSLMGVAMFTKLNNLDDSVLIIAELSTLVGLSLTGGSINEYLRARKFKNAINQQSSRQDE